MSTDVELERALASVSETLNDQKVAAFDPKRVQEIVDGALGGEHELTVDDGGGLHNKSGARVGAIRRTDTGEWITERQNESADRSDAAIPAKPPDED